MKPTHSLAISVTIAIIAFLIGRWTAPAAAESSSGNPVAKASGGEASGAMTSSSGRTAVRDKSERPVNMSRLSEQGARRMTPKERLDILAKGALVFDGTKQADMLCGLIEAMTKEEMPEAIRLLATAQDGGNACAQAVWDTFWKQWGRVDPAGCLEHFTTYPDSKSRTDARLLMEGWLETDPDAALAWAKQPRESRLDAAAAGMAISWSSEGDPKKLEAAILAMPPDSPVTKECLLDYFDLASLTKDSPTAAEIHDNLPASLKEAAWSVTLQRLAYTNPQAAKDWLGQHAGDPGQNYFETQRLVGELSREDVEGTAKWAAGLPPAAQAGAPHPAEYAIILWTRADRAAAEAWLATLPPDSPWASKAPTE